MPNTQALVVSSALAGGALICAPWIELLLAKFLNPKLDFDPRLGRLLLFKCAGLAMIMPLIVYKSNVRFCVFKCPFTKT